LNSGFRVRDPIAVVDEIDFWNKNYGIANFSFYDDALLVSPKTRAVPMLQEILRRKLNCSFHCPNGLHVREIDQEVATLLFRSGFKTIRFGFETADRTIQLETGGKVNNDEARKAVACLKHAGYRGDEIGMYILCGLPGQMASDVAESIDFIKSCGARPVIAEYSPIPHTAMWLQSLQTSCYDIENEPVFHNNTLLPCGGTTLSYSEYRELKNRARSNNP